MVLIAALQLERFFVLSGQTPGRPYERQPAQWKAKQLRPGTERYRRSKYWRNAQTESHPRKTHPAARLAPARQNRRAPNPGCGLLVPAAARLARMLVCSASDMPHLLHSASIFLPSARIQDNSW